MSSFFLLSFHSTKQKWTCVSCSAGTSKGWVLFLAVGFMILSWAQPISSLIITSSYPSDLICHLQPAVQLSADLSCLLIWIIQLEKKTHTHLCENPIEALIKTQLRQADIIMQSGLQGSSLTIKSWLVAVRLISSLGSLLFWMLSSDLLDEAGFWPLSLLCFHLSFLYHMYFPLSSLCGW